MNSNKDYTGMFTQHYYPSPDFAADLDWKPRWSNASTSLDDLIKSLGAHVPPTDIQEEETSIVFKIVAPESDKGNFDVEVKDGVLRVTHKVKEQTALTKNFDKKFELTGVLRLGSATASYKGGVLTVEIPKVKPKQISVE